MVKKLSASLLLPAELAETVSAYIRTIVDSGLGNSFILGIIMLLEKDLKGLNNALTAVRVNQLVDDVSEADAIRDDLFIGFRDLVDAYKRRRDASLIAAYEMIWPIIEKAGTRLYGLGYTEQSGKLEALFAKLDKPKYQEALTILNAIGIYAELKQAQKRFLKLYNDRQDIDTSSFLTLKEAKRPTVPHVNSLLDALNILDEVEPDTHTDIINKVNAITSSIMTTVRARKTKSENDDKKGFTE